MPREGVPRPHVYNVSFGTSPTASQKKRDGHPDGYGSRLSGDNISTQSMTRLGILFLLLLPASGPQRTVPGLASIEGVVVRAGTDTPIPGATVELTGIAPRTVEGSSTAGRGFISVDVRESESDGKVLSYIGTTRSDGRFEIRNIRPGVDYHLIALSVPEYLPAQYGQRGPTVPGRSITVVSGDHLTDLRIEMTPGATISGQVVDSRGQGLRNVQVELRRPWYLEGWRLLVEWTELAGRLQGVGKTNRAATARTNARGEFVFSGLAPAQYYVRTSFSDESSLKPINLRSAEVIADVRIVAPVAGPRWVTGSVRDTDGLPLRFGRILVFRRDVAPVYQRARVTAVPVQNGLFELQLPGPGKYVLTAILSDDPSAPRGRREIEVRDLDLRDIRLTLSDPFNIPGTVVFEGALPPTSVSDSLVLSLYPMTADLPAPRTVRLPKANGTFLLEEVLAGDYRVEVLPVLTVPPGSLLPAAFENVFVKSVTLDGRDLLNEGLHLEAPPRRDLQIVISANGGVIEGRVVDAGATTHANVKTVAVPSGSRRNRGDLYKFVSTDDEGRFRLTGLSPGEYRLFAFERVEEGAWQDPEFIRLFEARGVTVRVEQGQKSTVEIPVTPAWN